jgi:hypothetical protein
MVKSAWYCAFAVVLIVGSGAADEPHDLSSLDQPIELGTGSPSDDLKSLSKEQLLSFLTGQVADLKKQVATHEEQNADLKKQNRELGEQAMFQTVMHERFGFGGMMTSGSTMAMSSGFEKKELGEVALVSDPEPYVKSTLESGDLVSSTNGLGPSACSDPFINCNPALCEGQIPGFSGGLNCPPFVSTECPDDLSGLAYQHVGNGGLIKCKPFGYKRARKRLVTCYRYETGKICTKPAITHPNGASKSVVAIMLKRLVCSGNPEKCFTHKMGYCISNEKQCVNECAAAMTEDEAETEEAKEALAAAEESGDSAAVAEAKAALADAGQCMSNCTYFKRANAADATEDMYTQAYESLEANRNEIFVESDISESCSDDGVLTAAVAADADADPPVVEVVGSCATGTYTRSASMEIHADWKCEEEDTLRFQDELMAF